MEDSGGRTAYIDFSAKVSGFDTEFRVLETQTHMFVYVSQCEDTIHLYDEALRDEIVHNKIRPRKKLVVFCNMKTHESFEEIKRMIIDMLKK